MSATVVVIAGWWCERCGVRYDPQEADEAAVRARLAADLECAPGDVDQEDVDAEAAGCPRCGWSCDSHPIAGFRAAA